MCAKLETTEPKYRLVNEYMRELLVLHFSKRIVLLICFFANAASITLSDLLTALSPNLKDLSNFSPGIDLRMELFE
jgi:hypothetical protein